MKQFFTALTLVAGALLTLPFTGCGSSDDEPEIPVIPDNPDDLPIGGAIDNTILPGQWILESYTPENGSTEIINYPFAILPFSVKQDTQVTNSAGYEYWAEGYEPFTQAVTTDGIVTGNGIIGFSRAKNANLTTSQVYEIGMDIPDETGEGSYIIVIADLSYSNNILTSKAAAYKHLNQLVGTSPSGTTVGTLTMKKID